MKLLKGLNRDTAYVDQPGGTYRRARNMILDDLAGAMANEMSPIVVPAETDLGTYRFTNMEICGQFKVPGDRLVFAVQARNTSTNNFPEPAQEEQILQLNEDGSITEIASGTTGTFSFSASTPFQGVGYVNTSNQLVLVYTDGYNKPRYIVYNENTGDFNGPFLLFPEAKFPTVRPTREGANDTSGDILAGNYTFMLAYEVQAGTDNITQYGPAMGSFQIGKESTDENKKFRGSAKMKFYGLDTNYSHVRVYAVREFNGVEYVYYADRFAVPSNGRAAWSYTGQSFSDAPALDDLLIPRVSYETAQTLTVNEDSLHMANLSANLVTYEEGQAVANAINTYWTVDEMLVFSNEYDGMLAEEPSGYDRIISYPNLNWVGFTNRNREDNAQPTTGGAEAIEDWGGMAGGFMPGEVYALYIAFLMKDGTWSQAFHIPAGGSSGSFTSTTLKDDPSLSIDSINLNPDITGVSHNMRTCGRTGYVENENESYPSTTPWSDVNLDGDLVRHHLIPDPYQLWQATNTAEGGDDILSTGPLPNEWANMTCGLFFDNVVIPESMEDKIQGFQFFYAKHQTVEDRRIKGYAPAWRWTHDISDGLDLLRIYDPYLLAAKPEAANWKVSEVYSSMAYKPLDTFGYWNANVADFAYLPANVIYGDYNNKYREPCLGLQLDSAVEGSTLAAGFPGYWGAINASSSGQELHDGSAEYTHYGYHSQVAYDSLVADEDIKDSGGAGSVLTYNFCSVFGSYQYNDSGSHVFTFPDMADKTDPNYSMVYGASAVPGNTGSAYYDAASGNTTTVGTGDLPSGTFLGWGGAMGAFICMFEDKTDYFFDFEAQELAATTDFVQTTTADTYRSNNVVLGGDTFITPVVAEFMAPTDGSNTSVIQAANQKTYPYLAKSSYFTWSRVQPSKNDLDGTYTWQRLADDFGIGSGETPYYGEDLNTYNLGTHWFKLNEKKSAFPAVDTGNSTLNYPNRIIRSAKQSYESNVVAWGDFVAGDYYDNDLGKESIRNIESYQGELIIHHGNAIYKTRSKFSMDATGTNVFVGSGDIFQAPPQELFVDAAGYAGVAHWADTLLSRAGYTWVDRNSGRVFNLTRSLEELSANGLRNYMRDEFATLPTNAMTGMTDIEVPTIYSYNQGGYTIGFDPYNDRLLFTKRYKSGSELDGGTIMSNSAGETLSYSLRNQCWVSNHEYVPYKYFQTYNKLFMFNELTQLPSINNSDGGQNQSAVYELNALQPGTSFDSDLRPVYGDYSSYVDAVFNMGMPDSKVWQNFNWITRYGEGEGTSAANVTFDSARVYNDQQISEANGNFRMTDARWQWNQFRDDTAAGATGWFEDDSNTFQDDSVILDLAKNWQDRQRFISPYIAIRLETLNTNADRLYLLDVKATARKAYR